MEKNVDFKKISHLFVIVHRKYEKILNTNTN